MHDKSSRPGASLQDLRRRKIIGEGQFGKVLRCELNCTASSELPTSPGTAPTVVAVKVFKNASLETHAYCGRELAMMAACEHAHVTKARAPGTLQRLRWH